MNSVCITLFYSFLIKKCMYHKRYLYLPCLSPRALRCVSVSIMSVFFFSLDLFLPECGGHWTEPFRLVAAFARSEDVAPSSGKATGERDSNRALPPGAPLHHPRTKTTAYSQNTIK